jgi:predicted RND superfamily exporter protein
MNWFRFLHALPDFLARSFVGLARWSIRHPRRTLLVATLLTLAPAPGWLWLKLRTDGHALVSPDAPEVRYDAAIREQFGLEDRIVLLVRSPHTNGIFNPATIQRIRDLTAACMQLPGINPAQVLSLATEPSFRPRPGTLIQQKLLEPPLRSEPDLALLRDDLRRIQLYTGTLLAKDGRSAAILVGVPAGSDRTKLHQSVRAVLAAQDMGEDAVSVTGAPVAEALLGLHILENLGVPEALLGATTRAEPVEAGGWLFELRQGIARRIGLVPVAIAVMVGVFFVSFRRLLPTVLPLPEVGATLFFVFGLMGCCGVPIYLTIAVMPVLLTAMAVTDEIHIFSRYVALLRDQPRHHPTHVLETAMGEVAGPVVITSLTTALGFLSFGFSPLDPVKAFGYFTAIGVLYSMLYSLTVIPAILALVPPSLLIRQTMYASAGQGSVLAAGFVRLGLLFAHKRLCIIALIAALTVLLPFGLRRVMVQDSWIDGFDRDSEFRRATELVNEQFHGMHLLLVVADAPQTLTGEIPASALGTVQLLLPGDLLEDAALLPGSPIKFWPAGVTRNGEPPLWQTHAEMASRQGTNLVAFLPPGALGGSVQPALARAGRLRFEIVVPTHLRPSTIHALADLSRFIRDHEREAVGEVLGPAEYLETTRFMARPADPEARRLPMNAAETRLMWDYYRVGRGTARLHQIVDTNYTRSVTTVFLRDANFQDTARLMHDIRAYERKHLATTGITLEFAGDVAVSQSLIQGIVRTQLQSLAWSLVGILLVTTLLGRSLLLGCCCVLPSTVAVLINFACMGWLDIPLGVATSMFAGMTLGIGVDFAIHQVEAYRMQLNKGAPWEIALRHALVVAGQPVLINTLAISLGFGVLMLSQVPANARLGMLMVLGLVNCLVLTVLLLPPLLASRFFERLSSNRASLPPS